MTIRNRLTLRFTGLVSSILLLAFMSIYAFCWYFISSDFYRRLDRKAHTFGDMLLNKHWGARRVQQLSRMRKDQLPNQKIMVFNPQDSLVLETYESLRIPIPQTLLADIRQGQQKSVRLGTYFLVGVPWPTATGSFVIVASAENSYGDDFLRRLILALGGLFGLVAGITAFSGWLFAGDALRPMQQIDRTVSHIFPHNRDERLVVSTEPDEISRLSDTINQLLDRVADSLRRQRMFVSNVSHELKNPLTFIRSQLEVSLLNQREPEAYRQTIRSVLEDVSSLSALTHELLKLSQVTEGNAAHLLTEVVRVDELVWDVRDEVMALNNRYRVRVELGAWPDDPDWLTIQGNKTLLATALKNLCENACKFSDDGQASITVEVYENRLQVLIQNQGIPIPASDLPYIFEPFYRSRQTARVRGYGVGLSLVEQIIRLHRGLVRVTSGMGQPTIFTVELAR